MYDKQILSHKIIKNNLSFLSYIKLHQLYGNNTVLFIYL